jgi:predicted metal-dependent enzyme (double-stranded beta helix superfamily)
MTLTPRAVSDDHYSAMRSFCGELAGLMDQGKETENVVMAVKDRLADLIRRAPELPEQVCQTGSDHYARHLLYRDGSGRFEVVVMAWAPGQETPVHDHAGIWCVEGVARGRIEVTRYDLAHDAGEGTRLEQLEIIRAGLGECGALIPPVEYHKIANPFDHLALTIHVYGGLMRECRIFEPRPDGAWVVQTHPLSFERPEPAL